MASRLKASTRTPGLGGRTPVQRLLRRCRPGRNPSGHRWRRGNPGLADRAGRRVCGNSRGLDQVGYPWVIAISKGGMGAMPVGNCARAIRQHLPGPQLHSFKQSRQGDGRSCLGVQFGKALRWWRYCRRAIEKQIFSKRGPPGSGPVTDGGDKLDGRREWPGNQGDAGHADIEGLPTRYRRLFARDGNDFRHIQSCPTAGGAMLFIGTIRITTVRLRSRIGLSRSTLTGAKHWRFSLWSGSPSDTTSPALAIWRGLQLRYVEDFASAGPGTRKT